MTDPVPPIPVTSARRSLWDRVSVIWLVPLAALAIALGVGWQTLRERGTLIDIVFDDAAGVVARETELRYRNVPVGVVERVRFTADLARVVVSVRVEPEVDPFIDEDALFWVVRPEITTQRITGLETVLSGVFIEGSWDTVPGPTLDRYEGLAAAPLLQPGQEGLEFTLRSTDGTLTSSMPLIYQGVTVGQVGQPVVGDDGVSVSAPAVIFAPYDRLVTEATVFWDASGFSLSVGAGGAEVDFDSLSSLIVGGLAFDTFVSGAQAAQDGDVFEAYLYESSARDAIYADPNSPVLNLLAVFSGNVAGLAVGAPVELGGLRIGEVTDVDGLIDPDRFGDDEVRLQAVLALQPARLGLEGEEGRDAILQILQRRIAEDGLRARLATGSLLGGLKVQLVELPELGPGAIDLAALPYPALPVAPSQITDIAGTAEGLLERVDNLPVEQLLDSAIGLFDNASVLIASQDTQAIPGEINALLGDLRGVTASPEVQALPAQLAETLAEIHATVTQVRTLLEQVREEEAVTRVLAAVDSANAALTNVVAATEGVPQLVANLDAVAVKAQGLEIEPLLAELTSLSQDVTALVAQPGLQTLPNRVSLAVDEATAALEEARAILIDVNDADLAPRLAVTLDSARAAAQSIETAAAGAPELVERLNALAANLDAVATKAQGLEIEPFLAEITALSQDARALVAQPGVQTLPNRVGLAVDEATAALAEARSILTEVDAANVGPRLAATLDSARQAALSIETAAAGAPELVERLNAIAARVDALPLDSLVTEATGVATDLRALLQQPGVAELPARLVALSDEATLALGDARGILATVNDADLAERLATAITAGEEAATALRDGAARFPEIAERAESLIAGLGELPLEDLVAQLTELATSANALVSSETTQALPADLSASLAEVQGLLAEVREADVVGNVNATLQSARAAADTLPGLVERAGGLLDQAGTTLNGLASTGGIVAEAQSAIREVARAAEAVAELARTIERDPNSLIFGRD